MKNGAKLNLTRKWRSKTFDTIIGQAVSVRILKNSLFLDQIFPVYLFSGQRGCGKTSTARVFTSALNCEKLIDFRKEPKIHQVPCLSCKSCLAMEQGKHPDFTEIDAASHTGVDNIRQLIETASFLPIMGRKKVYLIDEVHMLSKAAFNALLKILEEPPVSVIFILATTDPHKVIDTVKSRCFQLFFGPPELNSLLAHLQHICKVEKINAELDALTILIREADGSIRDAMNLLEQVRFIESHITVDTIARALGYVSDDKLLKLLNLVINKKNELTVFLHQLDLSTKNIDFVWRRLNELIKMILYCKHDVLTDSHHGLQQVLVETASKIELSQLINFLDVLVAQEQVLIKTAHKSLALELFLLSYGLDNKDLKKKLTNKIEVKQEIQIDHIVAPHIATKIALVQDRGGLQESAQAVNGEQIKSTLPVHESVIEPIEKVISTPLINDWHQFLGLMSNCGDQFLISILKQAQFDGLDDNQVVQISFSDQGLFFKDIVLDKINLWKKYLIQVFGDRATLEIKFVARQEKKVVENKQSEAHGISLVNTENNKENLIYKNNNTIRASVGQIDVSDKEKWPLANQILEHFPGQVYEVNHE